MYKWIFLFVVMTTVGAACPAQAQDDVPLPRPRQVLVDMVDGTQIVKVVGTSTDHERDIMVADHDKLQTLLERVNAIERLMKESIDALNRVIPPDHDRVLLLQRELTDLKDYTLGDRERRYQERFEEVDKRTSERFSEVEMSITRRFDALQRQIAEAQAAQDRATSTLQAASDRANSTIWYVILGGGALGLSLIGAIAKMAGGNSGAKK
jgi:hypothetical protein